MELQGKIINILGDSITYGEGTSDKQYAYPAVLQQLTGAAIVRNYGINGTRIARQQGEDDSRRAFTARYMNMDDDADLVVVFGGTNDYGHGNAPFGTYDDRTADTFCGACHVLFCGLLEKYPTARIVVMTPMQCHHGATKPAISGKILSDYADAICCIAGRYSIPVLDLYRNLGICPDIDAQRERLCPDGLHPNDMGAARIASMLANFLKTI